MKQITRSRAADRVITTARNVFTIAGIIIVVITIQLVQRTLEKRTRGP